MKIDKDNILLLLTIICYFSMFGLLVAGFLTCDALYFIMAIYTLAFAIAFKSRMGGM
jgi:hypothetical protein